MGLFGGSKKQDNLSSVPEERNSSGLTEIDALKVMYYLMSADGHMDESEMNRFEQIGEETDRLFSYHKASVISDCKKVIEREKDSAFYLDNLFQGASEAIHHSQNENGGIISEKLLIWNLLAIGHSDQEYSDEEKRYIRNVARLLNIDTSVLLEMETAIHTINALETEENWLKSENRKYSEIESHLKDIDTRKKTILQGIKALIMD